MGIPASQWLFVEGPDDLNGLLHLLIRSGSLPECPNPEESPVQIQQLKSKAELLTDMLIRPKQTGLTAVGYVLDADGYQLADGQLSGDPSGFESTWASVMDRLRRAGIIDPIEIKNEGYVGQIGASGPKIGVWIMPDNQSHGAIEEFLASLTTPEDRLLSYARVATQTARTDHGATFTEAARPKAELSCWLSWQLEPGMPYGIAMRAGRFDHALELAQRFIRWFQRLFTI